MSKRLIAALFAIAALSGCYRTYYTPSNSMAPTLTAGTIVLVDRSAFNNGTPQRGEIDIFKPPVLSADDFIKRVIALPGDTFAIRHGTVYVNGAALREPYVASKASYDFTVRNYSFIVDNGGGAAALSRDQANIPPRSRWTAPDRLPDNCYIVLGDNRNESEDSHIWGCAQNGGKFWSGSIAGQEAHFTGRVVHVFRKQ